MKINNFSILQMFTVGLICLCIFFSFEVKITDGQSENRDQKGAKLRLNELQQQGVRLNSSDLSNPFFLYDLEAGDQGLWVKLLQKSLNEIGIIVSETGPGSYGQETEFFGTKTSSAVRRFQSMHAEEILAPVNLNQPNGYVGFYTRKKLNKLLRGSLKNAGISQSEPVMNPRNTNTNLPKNSGLSNSGGGLEITKYEFTLAEKRALRRELLSYVDESMLPEALQNVNDTRALDNTGSSEDRRSLQDRYRNRLENFQSFLKEGWSALARFFGAKSEIKAYAQLPTVFGGRVATVSPCPVPPNGQMVTVVGARPGSFTYFPGISQLRPLYAVNPRPGQSTLGSYLPGSTCFGPPPALVPLTQGTVIQMGVSQI